MKNFLSYTLFVWCSFVVDANAVVIPAPGQPIPHNDPNGVYCREYTQPVMIGGVRRNSYGTACQQPDGSWRIITNNQQPQEDMPIEFLGQPQYVGAPQYVAPPAAYYAMYPYPYGYGAPYPYYYSPYPVGPGVGLTFIGHDHYYHHNIYHR